MTGWWFGDTITLWTKLEIGAEGYIGKKIDENEKVK